MIWYPNGMADEVSIRPGRVVARLARQVEVAVASLDLTLSQYRVLGILADGREAASVLAEKLAVSRASVTGVVDGLVARGLVTRDHDASDRRRIGVEVTGEGRRLLAIADEEVDQRLRAIVARLEDDAAAIAVEGLQAWQSALDARVSARASAALSECLAETRIAERSAGVEVAR
jgi:long-chain acyl-CoA synthetase